MIDFTAYKRIKKLLSEGRIVELEEYLDKQLSSYYLKNARESLRSFSKDHNFQCFPLEDGRTVINNSFCLYILNSKEILTPDIEKKGDPMGRSQIDYKSLEELAEKDCTREVISIEQDPVNSRRSIFRIKELDKLYNFNKSFVKQANAILGGGEQPVYKVSSKDAFCLVKSPKGKGIFTGVSYNE